MVATWAMLPTSYVIYYASLKRSRDSGDLAVPRDDEPTLVDYAYFPLDVRTTFAASDVEVTTRRLRCVVLGQGLMSCAVDTVLIALTINIIASG